MIDIVERLCENNQCISDVGCNDGLMHEAAKDIGRLRSHVKSLEYDVSGQYMEIKRLQQALKTAAGLISTMNGYTKQHPHAIYKDLLSQAGVPVEVDADLKDEDGFYK